MNKCNFRLFEMSRCPVYPFHLGRNILSTYGKASYSIIIFVYHRNRPRIPKKKTKQNIFFHSFKNLSIQNGHGKMFMTSFLKIFFCDENFIWILYQWTKKQFAQKKSSNNETNRKAWIPECNEQKKLFFIFRQVNSIAAHLQKSSRKYVSIKVICSKELNQRPRNEVHSLKDTLQLNDSTITTIERFRHKTTELLWFPAQNSRKSEIQETFKTFAQYKRWLHFHLFFMANTN